MRDALEEHLASRLGTLGETVGEELTPPADLELQVARRRHRTRATRRWSGVAAAAVIVIAAATVAVARGSSGHGSIKVESSSTTPATVPLRDLLQPGTAMLSARGNFVVSLDASGHTIATMVTVSASSSVKYARATADHQQIWYLSVKHGSTGCGDVVRAQVDGGRTKIVAPAVTFDVSADGSRLALYGGGDLARAQCAPVRAGTPGRIVVIDLASSTSSSVAMSDVTSLRWSPDGSALVAATCGSFDCGFRRIVIPSDLAAPLVATPGTSVGFARVPPGSSDRIVFGPDGFYELATTVTAATAGAPASTRESIARYDPKTLGSPRVVFSGGDRWDVTQVVPTTAATYVVAAPAASPKASGLYRIEAGRLAFVRTLDSPGTFVPVAPFAPNG